MAKMNFKKCLQPYAQSKQASIALLLLRLVAGVAFMMHGFGKIQNPFAWMGPEAPVPGIFQFLAAISEFGGGLAWVLGLLTVLGSLGAAFTMLVAVYMHMIVRGDPFVSATGGPSYELAALFFAIAVVFMLVGPGRYSADAKIFGQKN
jgi:putative oxidoreductase